MKYLIMVIIASAFALASCAVDAPTESAPAPLAKTVKQLNWDVTIGLDKPSPPVTCGSPFSYLVDLSGVNNVTHLGRTTGSGTSCVAPITAITGDVTMNWVLEAANGDELHLTLTGTYAVNLSGYPNVVINQAGTYDITGGTGRFEGADGAGTYSGVQYGASDTDNSVIGSLTGTIEY